MRVLVIVLVLFINSVWASAQELNCKVTVTHKAIDKVDAKVFKALEKGLNEFMNNTKWTTDQFQPNERIDCNFLINVTEYKDEIFYATLNITATRPVFGTNYSTLIFNYQEKWEYFSFKFEESQTILFDENRIASSDALASNLTAIFAYYAYVILGYDYDSFSPMGGTEWFKKANMITTNAPSHGEIKGWKSNERNNDNRYWIVDQLLNPRFASVRQAWYDFHRQGLDMMTKNPEEGLKTILATIEPIDKATKDGQNPIISKLYFLSKNIEYQNFLSQVPADKRSSYIDMLSRSDIPNASKYRAIK